MKKNSKTKISAGSGRYSGRRKIIWKNIRGPKEVSALLISTSLGAGLLPWAPGTFGTLAAIPLAFCTRDWDYTSRIALWGGLTLLGTWAATVFDRTMGTSDNQNIVIDEVVGLGITAWTVHGDDWQSWLAAFLLFRFFDVLKPPPVRQIDRWSKNQTSPYWGGFGVIADDIVAGFQALLIMVLLQKCGVLPV